MDPIWINVDFIVPTVMARDLTKWGLTWDLMLMEFFLDKSLILYYHC
jgi:hypothetical protein